MSVVEAIHNWIFVVYQRKFIKAIHDIFIRQRLTNHILVSAERPADRFMSW